MISTNLFILSLNLLSGAAWSVITDPIVNLANGVSVQGTISSSGNVNTFLGIPYALPPTNERRWAPPEQWTTTTNETLNATSYGQACTQKKHGIQYGGEDCLYLNVFVHTNHIPVQVGTMLPIALWIHGGTYISGDSSQYDAQEIVELYNGHVIIVTINYRLNIFGFLGSDELRGLDLSSGSTGTLGLQDQRMAMQWVQTNIASFGGDPSAVTLYGQSAGAGSISSHLTMVKSQGLFSSAVLESGAFASWIVQNMTFAQKVYDNVLDEADCTDLICLQDLSTSELYDISQSVKPLTSFLPTAFVPAVDLVEIVTHPWVSVSAGNISNVPILLGTNSDEGVSYLPDDISSDLTEFEFFYMLVISFGFGDYRDEIEIIYITNATYPEEYDSTGTLYSKYWWAAQRFIGDYFFSCPAQYGLDHLYAENSRTSCSGAHSTAADAPFCSEIFGYFNKYQLANRGAFVQHGYELPLVFHLGDHLTTSEDVTMAGKVSTYWGHFFVAQDPSLLTSGVSFLTNEDLFEWEPYNSNVGNITTFSNDLSVSSTTFLKQAECALLNSILLESMQHDYPHSFSNLPLENSENNDNDSNSIFDNFGKKGVYYLIAIVFGLVLGGYFAYQKKYGMTHQEAQRFLSLREYEGPSDPPPVRSPVALSVHDDEDVHI